MADKEDGDALGLQLQDDLEQRLHLFLVSAVVGSSMMISRALNIKARLMATICFCATDKRAHLRVQVDIEIDFPDRGPARFPGCASS